MHTLVMRRRHSFYAMVKRCCLTLLLLPLSFAQPLTARDVFVVLSGGVSPFDNNYSQYLQAKALNAYLEKNYPSDAVWTFFGAGNVEGEPPKIFDVRRKIKRDGVILDIWLPGTLPRNRPASREVILQAFHDEILPAIKRGGTLYLFVGDHGSRPASRGESEIDLWSLVRDDEHPRNWRSVTNAEFGVTEFREVIVSGIGKGRVVFCMTQCHSGGFHSLGIPAEMKPNRRWFTRVPEWAKISDRKAIRYPLAAGFTATDEYSLAAGCDPDPDPDRWAGYERFVPENLLGMDLFTCETVRPGLNSFLQAHIAATLEDHTLDKPASTSDEYLEHWSALVELRLAKELRLSRKVRDALRAYDRAVEGNFPSIDDEHFRERRWRFEQFIHRMTEQNPEVKELLLTGSRADLEKAIGANRRPRLPSLETAPSTSRNRPPRRSRGRSSENETRRLWRETVGPAWSKIVESGAVTNLTPISLEFEKHLLKLEEEKNRYFLNGGRVLDEEVFWFSGYGDPTTLDMAEAEANARWSVKRREKILSWARASEDDEVAEAAKKILERTSSSENESHDDSHVDRRLTKKTAAERTLFYRRVLAAWEFLVLVNERAALKRLQEIIELENTPLPPRAG